MFEYHIPFQTARESKNSRNLCWTLQRRRLLAWCAYVVRYTNKHRNVDVDISQYSDVLRTLYTDSERYVICYWSSWSVEFQQEAPQKESRTLVRQLNSRKHFLMHFRIRRIKFKECVNCMLVNSLPELDETRNFASLVFKHFLFIVCLFLFQQWYREPFCNWILLWSYYSQVIVSWLFPRSWVLCFVSVRWRWLRIRSICHMSTGSLSLGVLNVSCSIVF